MWCKYVHANNLGRVVILVTLGPKYVTHRNQHFSRIIDLLDAGLSLCIMYNNNCVYQFHICCQLLPTRKDTRQCADNSWCHTTVLWVFRLMSQWHRDDGSVLQNLDFPTLSLPISSILTSVWHTLQFLCHSTQQQPTQHSLLNEF